MLYLISQIIVCLLIAFILGILVGWLLRSWKCRQTASHTESELQESKIAVEKAQSLPSKLMFTDEKDDLKLISGIGPILEKHLCGLGIHTFHQIAELTPKDIEQISATLDQFQGRIERDEWVTQARELYNRKYEDKI